MTEHDDMTLPSTPNQAQRQKLLDQMTPIERRTAKSVEEKLNQTSLTQVLAYYDVGALLARVAEEGEKTGRADESIKAIVTYLGMERELPRLLVCVRVAKSFPDRDWLKGQVGTPRADGQRLDFKHFASLAMIEGVNNRKKLLARVRAENWSANDLRMYIQSSVEKVNFRHGGGRKPSRPQTPISGVHRVFQMSKQLANYGAMFLKDTVIELDELVTAPPEGSQDKMRAALEEACNGLDAMEETRALLRQKLGYALNRLNKTQALPEPAPEPEEPSENESLHPGKPVTGRRPRTRRG